MGIKHRDRIVFFIINGEGNYILFMLKKHAIDINHTLEQTLELFHTIGKKYMHGTYMEYIKIAINDCGVTQHTKYQNGIMSELDKDNEDAPAWWNLPTSDEIWADVSFGDFGLSMAMEYSDVSTNGYNLEERGKIKKDWRTFCEQYLNHF